MWITVLLSNGLASLTLLCIGSVLTFSLTTWKRTLPWLLAGWVVALAFQELHQYRRLQCIDSSVAQWVLIRPDFLPTSDAMLNETEQSGIWTGSTADGKRCKIWLRTTVMEPRGSWRWAFVQMHPIEKSDLTSSFDFEAYLKSQGVVANAKVLRWGESVPLSRLGRFTERCGWSWRRHLSCIFAGDGTGLLLGIFGGDKKSVPMSVKKAFQKMGVAHLLSVSGYHVGLVAGVFLVLLRAQNRWIKRLSSFGIIVSMWFVAACGSPVSGLRSWIMLVIVWGMTVRGRRPFAWDAFGVAAALTCLVDVGFPRQLGTQLSFLATASLLDLARRPNVVWIVPWRAQWATSCLTIPAFSTWPVCFYPVNLVAGPMMLLLGLAVIGCLIGVPCVATWTLHGLANLASIGMKISDVPGVSLSTFWLGGKIGFVFLLPFSLRWALHFVPADRRALFWSSFCFICLVQGIWLTHQQATKATVEWYHLRGTSGTFAVTDGYAWRSWTFGNDDDQVLNAPGMLGLEGPREFWCAHGARVGQKIWAPPPIEIWTQKKKFNSISHRMPWREINSASTSW